MGWALKPTRARRARFTPAQKAYLNAKFKLGEESGKKADPASVARSMMCAKDNSDNRLFCSDDFLTSNQIASFFSRLAAQKTVDLGDAAIEDVEAAAHEQDIEELVSDAARELRPKYPIVYETYNLCELLAQKKMETFSISTLNDMCLNFGIDTSTVKTRRKKPYIDKLLILYQECACQHS